MVKILSLLLIPLLLFSCNGLSDEDMEVRLAELELMKLANEHLEEDIDEVLNTIDAKMALPENKKRLKPITTKIWEIDSILNTKIDFITNSDDNTTYFPIINSINDTILNIIDIDSTYHIEFNGKTYYDSTKTYSFTQYNLDLKNLRLELFKFISNIHNPSELELKEVKTIVKSHFLLLRKRTLRYLIQKMISSSYFISANQINISLEIENTKFKPAESFTFSVFLAVPYFTNYSIINYILDDSIFKEKLFFNTFSFDSIKIPTQTIGRHKIKINQHQWSDKNSEFTFNYEVIEQK
jgi:hypothetical protein